ncbi:MAG: 2-oxo acid dehydrogenase subunit E2, partial [Alphaproteobacteria bacterium]
IAAAMTRANRDIPHYYLGQTIDMEATLAWLERANAERPIAGRLIAAVPLLKAVALALRDFPDLNGFWIDGAARSADQIHVGWSISLRGGGLIAPAILDADGKSVDALMADLRDLVKRVRAGGLRGSELSMQTITVTSLGDQGVDSVFGVVYPPQLALVGFGRVQTRPRAVDGKIAVRRVIEASLAADHRASDGHRGGLFLAAIDRILQEPEKL